MKINRAYAQRLANNLRTAVDRGRWTQNHNEQIDLNGLEMALAQRIQAGQPALEAMQSRLISTYAAATLASAVLAVVESRLVGTPRVLAALGMDPVLTPVAANVAEVDFRAHAARRTARVAKAA